MTNTERTERIDKLSTQIFYLEMKDSWTAKDYETMRNMRKELKELEGK